jgi:Flp pilus assembly protein TadG
MLQRFKRDEKGTVLTAFAVAAIPIGLAVAGAVDFARMFTHRTQMQAQTDAAALAAAISLKGGKAEIAQRYFTNTAIPSTVSTMASGLSVTVTATSHVPSPFLSIIGTKTLQASTTATALRMQDGPPACILALNETASGAVTFSGSSSTTAIGCAIYSNSSSPSAISVQGSATVKADGFCSVGGFSGPAALEAVAQENCNPAADPFSTMPTPTASGCSYNNLTVQPNKSRNLVAGVYCGGLDIKGDATLAKGIYFIKDGALSISSQSNVSGKDVTFILLGKGAGFSINGGASIDLSAPMTGDHAGMLIFQDRASNVGAGNTLNGNANTLLNGTIYTPTQTVTINGSGSFGQNNVFMPVIADQIKLTGNAVAQSDITKVTTPSELAKLRNQARLVK